jgi:hypothetical protein
MRCGSRRRAAGCTARDCGVPVEPHDDAGVVDVERLSQSDWAVLGWVEELVDAVADFDERRIDLADLLALARRGPGDRMQHGQMIVVVSEQRTAGLAGAEGLHYTSPPQTERQARVLAGLLNGAPVDGPGPWRQAIAGGQRTIELRPDLL